MKRRTAVIISGVLLLVLAVALSPWLWGPRTHRPVARDLPQTCRDLAFEAVVHVVCEIDLGTYDVTLNRLDPSGRPYGSIAEFDRQTVARDVPALLAMNAGMYHKDLSPVGLYVEDGVVQAPLNLDDGEGNFFMKPNGVFFIGRDGKAGVMESAAFAAARPDVLYATQSGPMLVAGGQLHPKFEENGASRYIRNGVCAPGPDKVVLAISRTAVSLGSFARLFRDGLGCRDALFLDGDVSTLSDGSRKIVGGDFPAGPILAVRVKE